MLKFFLLAGLIGLTFSQSTPKSCMKACAEIYAPLCGSDGKTYSNVCELEIVMCESGVQKVNDGPCGTPEVPTTSPEPTPEPEVPATSPEPTPKVVASKEPTPEPESSQMPVKTTPKAKCDQMFCPTIYAPVCGNDGKSYSSACFLSIINCNHALTGLPQVTVAHKGSCRRSTIPPAVAVTVMPNVTQKCMRYRCFESYKRPVCAADGKTYANQYCYLQARCMYSLQGLDLEIVNRYGACKNTTVFKPLPKLCTLYPGGKRCLRKTLCGTDGISYSSQCYLDYYNCKYNKNVTVASEGYCPFTTPAPCSRRCYNYKYEVCGSDGKTYKNSCFFSNAACKAKLSQETLTMVYRGACGSKTTPHPFSNLNCNYIRYSRCPSYYRPLCGSDGKTYKNTCEFSQMECKMLASGKELKIASIGPCPTSTPVVVTPAQ